MFRSLLLCLTVIVFSQTFAQRPAGGAAPSASGPASGAVEGLGNDNREWMGPFVPLTADDQKYYRTFCVGWFHSSAGTNSVPNGYMVGLEFDISNANKDPRINSLRPIYGSPDGGTSFGDTFGNGKGKQERVVAKKGYALNAVTFNHGSILSGITLKFARLLPDGTCDPNDTYESPTFGRGGGTIIEGGKFPFCGVYVTPSDSPVIEGVAFLVSQPLVLAKAPELRPRPRGGMGIATVGREMTAEPPVIPVPQPAPQQPQIVVVERPDPAVEAKISEILQVATQRLVLVQGANGRGSGFTYRIGGKPFCATNQHVAAGNAKLQFASLQSGNLPVGVAQVAVGHDLLVASVPPETPAFDAVSDITKEAAIGDVVVVMGDPEGAGVVRPIPGRLMGIGPNLIEVSAPFVEGNSGSPIIHLKSGKVLGIASYATVRAFDSGRGEPVVNVRRFGYRLDTVKAWQPVNWQIYNSEAAAVADSKSFTEVLMQMFGDLQQSKFARGNYKDARLQQALARLPQKLPKPPNAQQQAQYVDAFVRELRNTNRFQTEAIRRRLQYDYFQRDSDGEAKLRDAVVQAIEATKAKVPLEFDVNIPSRSLRTQGF
jgi:hypothetical protein